MLHVIVSDSSSCLCAPATLKRLHQRAFDLWSSDKLFHLLAIHILDLLLRREWMDERMNRWMDEQMSSWMDERMNGWPDKQMNWWMDEQMNYWMNEWMDEQMNGWSLQLQKLTERLTLWTMKTWNKISVEQRISPDMKALILPLIREPDQVPDRCSGTGSQPLRNHGSQQNIHFRDNWKQLRDHRFTLISWNTASFSPAVWPLAPIGAGGWGRGPHPRHWRYLLSPDSQTDSAGRWRFDCQVKTLNTSLLRLGSADRPGSAALCCGLDPRFSLSLQKNHVGTEKMLPLLLWTSEHQKRHVSNGSETKVLSIQVSNRLVWLVLTQLGLVLQLRQITATFHLTSLYKTFKKLILEKKKHVLICSDKTPEYKTQWM